MCYYRYTLITLAAFIYSLSSILKANVSSISSSNHAVTGEVIYITYIIDANPSQLIRPEIKISDASCKLYSTRSYRNRGSLYGQVTYSFKASKPGTYTIPKTRFSNSSGNPSIVSDPVRVIVSSKDSLNLQQIQSTTLNRPDGSNKPRKTYSFYTQLVATKSSLFPNEVTQLEYKIYLPRDLRIAQWGLPTGSKTNATAWRFETPRAGLLNGTVNINGTHYQVGTFHTTVSGIKPGLATIGPFKNRIVHNVPIIGNYGMRAETQKMHIESQSIDLDIRNLPPNPPASFKGDVGHYSMSIDLETKSEISSTESIKAKVLLNGTGKLSELSPPDLTNDKHWKLISQSKRELDQRRKSTEGFVEFDYLIQPTNTGPATTTPGFIFSYLDPDLEAYTTIDYPGLPIKINLTSNNDEISNNMTNSGQMLGLIKQIELNEQTWFQNLPPETIHIIPALICVSLFFILAQKKYRAYRLNQSHKIVQSKSLDNMANQEDNDFLKAASNYIQRWVDVEKHPEFKEIQELRDDHCYKPDSPVKISKKRKQSILDSLQKLMILLLCFTPYYADGSAYESYEKGNYQNALEEYKNQQQDLLPVQSPDLFYNIGNCYQKLEQPAQAAIYYHRALRLDPFHTQSDHNLVIIQQNNNSIVANDFIKQNSLAYWISFIPIVTYSIILILSLWFILISILWMFVLKPAYRTKMTLLSVSASCLILTAFALYGKSTHPDSEKIPASSFGIISKETKLLEQPATSSSEKTAIPTASECRIISTSGTFSYIELTDITKTKGWVLTESILKL